MNERAPHAVSETTAAYVEAARRVGSSRHGAAGTTKRLPVSTVNAGIAAQVLRDNPDLAKDVTRTRTDGLATGHGVTFYVTGDESTVEAWTEFLGPAARIHQRQDFGTGWEQAVTTIDTCVIVRHHDGAN